MHTPLAIGIIKALRVWGMQHKLFVMDTVRSDANSRRLFSGQKLVDVPPGEKLVISGISGFFPNSNNVQHFMENLYNKIDLCDCDERRWVHISEDIPKLSGKMYNVEKFDSGYFGIPELQANLMDPMCRLLLERSVEAIMDAGINPEELKGRKTGIFVGACHSETEKFSFYSNNISQTFPIIGCTRSMLAQQLSYTLQLVGPSFIFDTACSSGLYAFETAYRSILENKCEIAIVAASNMCMDPYITLQFSRLGILNMNTGCRPFDRDATGYTRSEGTVVMILQKEKHARRVYAKIVHAKVNVDGFKEQGITYPSGEDQLKLLQDVYEECRVDPSTMAYVEAHGTGTRVGDPEELSVIDKLFCTNRDKPLLIGSVKGNIGHSEPVSGLCSIIKVLFGMNFDYIPPNIHYDNPRPDIPALIQKRLCVVTEKTKWPEYSRLAGINCFGFGGANCHVVLEKLNKKKEIRYDDIPRLVCFSGRTKDAIETIQESLSNNELDYEFIRLIQEVYSKNMKNQLYRGYSILSPNKTIQTSICKYNTEKYTLYLCLANENAHSCSVLAELQKLTTFRETYERCVMVLKENNVTIQVKEDEPDNILQRVLVTVILQLGIIDIFKAANIRFDYLRGYSIGEFTAAYANGTLKLEQAIMASYTINKHFIEFSMSDAKIFEKLSTRIQSIIKSNNTEMNKVQTSMSNMYPYGSIEYFLFNVLNPNLVASTFPPFEKNAVVVNVDFKCNLEESMINLEVFKDDSYIVKLFNCIGRLYELGYNSSVDKLYPEIKWPVSAGTPIFSPLVKWNHTKQYYVPRKEQDLVTKINEKTFRINVLGNDMSFYKGHVIDGRTLFPATGYIFLVWQLFANIKGEPQENLRVCFDNVKFLRATTFSKDGILFAVIINKDGYFEIVERDAPVASGRVHVAEKFDKLPISEGEEKDNFLLLQKDIYKELRLRGYHYKGAFKAVQQMFGNEALISWNSNWISFLDNMLQLSIIKEDTRSLMVPTGIDRVLIDPEGFMRYIESLDEDKIVPCYVNKLAETIQTNSIQITGLQASILSRKRQMHQPVLETYKFTPNNLRTNVSTSARINMQIVLENKAVINMKILEVVNDESDTIQPLSPEIVKVLEDIPLIQPEITVFSENEINVEMKGIQLQTEKVYYDNSFSIYIGTNILQNQKEMKNAVSAIVHDGFIITIESNEYANNIPGINILTTHQINNKFIYLLMMLKQKGSPLTIDVSNLENIDIWLDVLKTNYKSKERTILYAQNNNLSGILGLTNCVRREPNGENVSCFFIRDKAPNFDKHDIFFKSQIDKNMTLNVYQDGQWGTYRHLKCNSNTKVKTEHFYGNTSIRGDLSSFDWFEGKLSTKDDKIIHIYYAALNFRDVMLASGKLPIESITRNRLEQECVIGFEFSGRDKDGNRIMGITKCGSNSNLVQTKSIWSIPSHWSLEDAATIPVVYLTVLKSFHEAKLKHGSSILIHSGTGGIGQAALNISEYYKCNIFTTVGTEDKKEFLLKNHPYLQPTHIGNSRNTTFEDMIFRETNGRGVDLVLNSLSEDKLHASVRCLAKGGHFIEIGKYDLSNDTRINANLLSKGCTYQGVMLDADFKSEELILFFKSLLDMQYIKPLKRTVFEMNELENAFRYMTTGKHMGKVLIKFRDEEKKSDVRPTNITQYTVPKFYCDPALSYVIIGGLGGFGLELADWLMLRGAKTLILSSRNGITTGYQQSRIRNWEVNGAKTIILQDDITTYEGCRSLIIKASSEAPVGGIFNLAVELCDGLLENLTHMDFHASLRPKAYATIYLDKISMEQCPRLQQFVVFSSVSCGRGNAGQTNYGMSNSIMERVCEQRKASGFPALAIQWGAVGDVGLVAEMQKEATEIAIGGTLQQRITNCLHVLEKFLKQNEPVVSSMVVAEKFESRNTDNIVDAVLCMLGIHDIKTISLHSTLAELGMDSMMAIEIKQTFEREYDIYLSVQDMRILTFARLLEIDASKGGGIISKHEPTFDLAKLVNLTLFDENNYQKVTVTSSSDKDPSKPVLVLPGIQGSQFSLQNLMDNLKYTSSCLQYKMRDTQMTFEDFIQSYYPLAKQMFTKSKSFNIIAHSFGGVLAMEIVSRLEKEGFVGKVVLLDSSPDYLLKLLSIFNKTFDAEFENKILLRLVESFLPPHKLPEMLNRLQMAKSSEDRKQIAATTIPDDSSILNQHLYETGQSIFAILLAFVKYKFVPDKKVTSKILLCKPTLVAYKDIPDDYCLSNHAVNLEVQTFDGDHNTILENSSMYDKINDFLSN